tara:strand:+ start:192 stop:365 length:174 start_codon:yes stop_codon:yes gene_type:complete
MKKGLGWIDSHKGTPLASARGGTHNTEEGALVVTESVGTGSTSVLNVPPMGTWKLSG